MSPEQVRGNPDEIDLRSDVYSLGVILYELLTGRLPHDVGRSALPEAVRAICTEPPRPLKKSWRGTRRLDADLETIVEKALEKEPAHRYQSASALAEDVERYLTNQPILARPPSTTYQFRKLVARHKAPFAFVAVVFVLLAAFAAAMMVQAGRIARQRDRGQPGSGDGPEGLGLPRGPLPRPGSDRGQGQHGDRPRDPGPGGGEGRTGACEPAPRPGEAHGDHGVGLHDMSWCLNDLGIVHYDRSDYAEARLYWERALAIKERALGPDHPDVAITLNNLGSLLVEEGDFAAARPYLERSLAVTERVFGPEHPETALSLQSLAAVLRDENRFMEAERLFRRALAIHDRAPGPPHPGAVQARQEFAKLLRMTNRIAEAESLEARAPAE